MYSAPFLAFRYVYVYSTYTPGSERAHTVKQLYKEKMLRVCRSFMLLLLLVHLSTCVYIRLIKTVTFHDISESEKERILLFLTVNMDGDGPR